MSDLNNLNLEGRLVKDSVLLQGKNGVKTLQFTIASNLFKKNSTGGYDQKTSFIHLCLFDKYAEKMKPYLIKGQKIIVEGFLRQDIWMKDDKKNYSLSVGIKKIHLESKPKENTEQEEFLPEVEETTGQEEMVYDDREEF